jgi:acetolactate decarboxylase
MDIRNFLLGIGVAIVLMFFFVAVITGFEKAAGSQTERDTLYQISTIDALMQGAYEGVQPVSEVKRHGDFGIGTFHALDGEMIVLDGTFYHAKADGRVYPAQESATTPLATVTYFGRDFSDTTDRPMNFSEFSSIMPAGLPTKNMIYAVRIDSTFPLMKVRAIPEQKKPYPTLADAAKNQSVFTYNDAKGTVVGFYTPLFVKGLNVVGFHLHFISDDRMTGGHILDLTVPENSRIDYDTTETFTMALPTRGDFTGIDFSGDLSKELEKIEN